MPPSGEGGLADAGVASSMTLVVKAANQKYNDQTIECEGSWTVRKLKSHLSEVYPCKPRENQQKIIFSGRLLQDHLVLKDVLRSFDPGSPTTVHLVCSGQDMKEPTPISSASVPPSSGVTTSSGIRRRATPASQTTTTTTNASGTSPAVSSSGWTTTFSQVPSSFAQPLPNPMVHPFANLQYTPESYYTWLEQYRNSYSQYMQQTYSSMGLENGDYLNPHLQYQQYWQQYMQYMQAYQIGCTQPWPTFPATSVLNAGGAPVGNPEARVGGAAAAAGNEAGDNAAAAGRMNAGGGPLFDDDEEEEGRNRDWLDWLYILSRLGVLLSIIYFYSTLGRFMLVFGFCFLVYVVRNHFQNNRINNNDRNQRNNNIVNNGDGNIPRNDEEDAAADAPVGEGGNEEELPPEAADEGEPAPEAPDEANAEPALPVEGPSAWTFAVTIVTTFFSSLIPQPPPAN